MSLWKYSCLAGVIWCCIFIAPALQAEEIALRVDRYLPDDRPQSAVRFGVPFPIDTLATSRVQDVHVLDDQGQVSIPQKRVLATWDASGEHGVRWLLIDMRVTRGREYRLVFNAPLPAGVSALPAVAVLQGDHIQIDAGAITGSLSTRGFDPFHQLSAVGAPIAVKLTQEQSGLGDREFSAFYVEHETRGIFRSDLDKDATVTLEEAGPQRAVILAQGWYTNEAGEKFCRFSIRMHIVRDQPDLRIDHTWIYTGLSAEDRLRSVSMQIRRCDPQTGNTMRGFMGNADLTTATSMADFTGTISMVQDTTPSGHAECVIDYGNQTRYKIAEHGGGWLTMHGTLGTQVALRDAWQQYPWGMDAQGGIIRVHFWPPGQRLLDTSWDGYWQLLTEQQKHTLTASKPRPKGMSVDNYMQVLRSKTNATGAAKTHELHLSFSGPDYGRWARQLPGGYGGLAREVAYPVVAAADTNWMARSLALDWMPHAPRDYATFRDEEHYFDAILQLVTDSVQNNGWHGFWDWGGYHQFMNPTPPMPSPFTWNQDAGQASWHRARPKSHYLWGGFPWLQYMRSGDRKWLRYAQTYTLYSADRAHAHHDGHGRVNGSEYHYDNSEVHWMGGYQRSPGGDQIASNLQAKDDYAYMYWLTGDRHALDVLIASADLICQSTDYGQPKPGFSTGNEIRNTGMLLHRLCIAYQATWNPRYLEKARQLAASFYPLTDVDKVANAEKNPEWFFHEALGWAYEGMWLYWNLTHDEQFKQPFLAFINRGRDYGAGIGNDYGTARALAYGYMLTGDLEYLNLARGILDDQVSMAVTPYSFLPLNKMNFIAMPRAMGAMTLAPEAWRKAYLPTHEHGRVLTYRAMAKPGNPAYAGYRLFIREATDQPWSFSLVATFGGRFVLYRPDGQIAAEQTFNEVQKKYVRFDVPADGQSGDYRLLCVEPGKGFLNNTNPELLPKARVVGCPWPVTIEAFLPEQINGIAGRAFYFSSSDQSDQTPVIWMSPLDPRRPVVASNPDHSWTYRSFDHVPGLEGSRSIRFPEHQPGTVYSVEFPVPPWWVDNGKSRPTVLFLNNAPRFIAANPEDLFLPAANP